METDYQKLLNACKEYRAKVDELLEENNELHQRLITIPDEVWSKADLVKQIHQAYAERDELQKENTKLKDALKEEKIHRSLDGWNEAAIINELKRENAALLDLIEDMARQHCDTAPALCDYNGQMAGSMVTDSGALSVDGEALMRLAQTNPPRFRIVAEGGRMVVGYWPENDPRKEAQP